MILKHQVFIVRVCPERPVSCCAVGICPLWPGKEVFCTRRLKPLCGILPPVISLQVYFHALLSVRLDFSTPRELDFPLLQPRLAPACTEGICFALWFLCNILLILMNGGHVQGHTGSSVLSYILIYWKPTTYSAGASHSRAILIKYSLYSQGDQKHVAEDTMAILRAAGIFGKERKSLWILKWTQTI